MAAVAPTFCRSTLLLVIFLLFFSLADNLGAGAVEEVDAEAGRAVNKSGDDGILDNLSEAKLNELFHWAIEHSDPDALREAAASVGGMTAEEVVAKRKRMLGVLRDLDSRPSEGELMKEAISMLRDGEDLGDEEVVAVLEVLKELVEPIDNANDLDKMGGTVEVVRRLRSQDGATRAAACSVLGTAASNNDKVQGQLLEYGTLETLLELTRVETVLEARVKALYAMGILIRYGERARAIVYENEGLPLLHSILAEEDDVRLRRKALGILADVLEADPASAQGVLDLDVAPVLRDVVQGGKEGDGLEMREKALDMVHSLLIKGGDSARFAFKGCDIDAALRKFSEELVPLQTDEDLSEYASEIMSMVTELVLLLNPSSSSGEL